MKFSSQRTQIDAASWKISRKARTRCGESGPEQTRHESSNAYRRENCEASNSAQHVVSKGNARSLRVHDYRGAQGAKKLAKLSVRHKRNSKRGYSLPVSSDSRQTIAPRG